jgi:RecA/RadA recombinase
MSTTTYETLEEIARAVNKKFGDEVAVQGSRIQEALPRITTGVLAFDLMLGGGWPVSQCSEIVGDE